MFDLEMLCKMNVRPESYFSSNHISVSDFNWYNETYRTKSVLNQNIEPIVFDEFLSLEMIKVFHNNKNKNTDS